MYVNTSGVLKMLQGYFKPRRFNPFMAVAAKIA